LFVVELALAIAQTRLTIFNFSNSTLQGITARFGIGNTLG